MEIFLSSMDDGQVLDAILRWFGHRPFRVRDLTDEMVEELTPLLLGAGETRIGQRTAIGRRLSRLDGRRFSTDDDRRAVFIMNERARGNKAGTYQIQEVQFD